MDAAEKDAFGRLSLDRFLLEVCLFSSVHFIVVSAAVLVSTLLNLLNQSTNLLRSQFAHLFICEVLLLF